MKKAVRKALWRLVCAVVGHRWKCHFASVECGKIFDCDRCGRRWSPKCGTISR